MAPEVERTPPPYRQIADGIRSRIQAGELQPGDRLPSERDLAQEWGVTRPTAGRALAVLKSEGLVESRGAAGSYVTQRSRTARRARDRFGKSRRDSPLQDPDETQVITAAELAPAPPEVAGALGVGEGELAILRRRIMGDASGPTEISSSWWAPDLAGVAPRLLSTDPIDVPYGALGYVEEITGRKRQRTQESIYARQATDEEADGLGLAPGAAVLVIERRMLDADDEPLEFNVAVLRSDQRLFEDDA